jgi:hypothetical protein
VNFNLKNLVSTRNSCCICSDTNLVQMKNLSNWPIYMGTTSQPIEEDIFYDQNWVVCDYCGTLQLKETLPLELLYSKNHHSEVVGDTWKKHHAEFARFIQLANPESICEIGSAHDYLAGIILDSNPSINYLSIEPDQTYCDPRVKHIAGFAEDFRQEICQFKFIVHSHVLEHVYNPSDFLRVLSDGMTEESKMIISFPNITELLHLGGANSLNFEHTYYLTPEVLEYMCDQLGLVVTRFQEFGKHSYFVELMRSSKVNETKVPGGNFELFTQMWVDLEKFIKSVNSEIEGLAGENVYIFGAHVFTQALVSLGLNVGAASGILDNSKAKQGQRLYGTNLIVHSPEIIAQSQNPVVVLKASHYQDEIRSQLLGLNSRTKIIE